MSRQVVESTSGGGVGLFIAAGIFADVDGFQPSSTINFASPNRAFWGAAGRARLGAEADTGSGSAGRR